MSQTRAYLSIGEVFKQLRDEFPEISISKIRFFESEGLIEPERTASGYRKFYENDIARLKYILRLQRDQFLPLKVIRRKLEHFDPAAEAEAQALQQSGAPGPNGPAPASPSPIAEEEDFLMLEGGLNLSIDDLSNQTGLDTQQLRELEEFGLIDSHTLPSGDVYYDEDDLVIAKLCRDFGKFGLEARHLKMYRQFADKEAGLFEQVLVPLNRIASVEGKKIAGASVNELAKLSKRMKHLLLRARLKEHLAP